MHEPTTRVVIRPEAARRWNTSVLTRFDHADTLARMTSARSRFSTILLSAFALSTTTACDPHVLASSDTGVVSDTGPVVVDMGVPGHDTGPTPPIDANVPDTGVPVDAFVANDAVSPTGVPAFRTPHPEIADMALARQALAILGAPQAGATSMRCTECHTLSRSYVRYWRGLSDTSMHDSLTDLAVTSDASAAMMMTSLQDPTTHAYTPHRLGIWATATRLPWFQYVVAHGTTGDIAANQAAFVTAAGMPLARAVDPPLTQAEFDIVAEWFLRGIPNVDDVLPVETTPTTCLPSVTSEVRDHITAMETMGWAARDRTAGMLMYGCAGATGPAGCFATATDATTTTYGANWVPTTGTVTGEHIRLIYTLNYHSSYWTRSSPDGRFISHGATTAPNLRFIDLQRPAVIGGAANYDPSFFPDGSGFIIQTAAGTGAAHACEMNVLTSGTPTMLTFTEPGCTNSSTIGQIGLYEHVGTSLDGTDYWAISGTNVYDPAHTGAQQDPQANFTATARATLYMMTNNGTQYVPNGTRTFSHPYEGDAVVSPSLRVVVTRGAGPGNRPISYVLRALDVTGSGTSLAVSSHEIGRYCAPGGKPAFSLDERFIAYYHYISGDADARERGFTGASDPGFAGYTTRGGADVYLIDLFTGNRMRLTNMAAGQFALFPHFRADGWIYFLVRSDDSSPERIFATDAAVLYH